MKRLDGKIAIITGASKGLGEADSRRFIEEGATVIMTDVDVEAGETLAAELGENAEFRELDVRNEDSWKELIGDVVKQHLSLIHI